MKKVLIFGFCLAILCSAAPVAMGHQVVDETTFTQADQLTIQHIAPISLEIKAYHVSDMEVLSTPEVASVEFDCQVPTTASAVLANVITTGYVPVSHCNSPPHSRCRG
jgi:hypothetical protein